MASSHDRHALVLCFNEDFTKNIDKLKAIYEDRFSEIVCIAPDHYGRLEPWYRKGGYPYAVANSADRAINRLRRVLGRRNLHEAQRTSLEPDTFEVWRVQGFKHYFQDFFWQVRKNLLQLNVDWYWFVADDLLLQAHINEDSIASVLLKDARSKSVICRPFYARDEWTLAFHRSIDDVVGKLRDCGSYPLERTHYDFPNDLLREGPSSRRVLCSCADFFGCHKDILSAALEKFHKLAERKVFVEVAVPNTILELDPHCSYVSSYEWDFEEDRGSEEKIRAFLSGGDQIFYHPMKLSALDKTWLKRTLQSGERPR